MEDIPLEFGKCRLSPPRELSGREVALIERLLILAGRSVRGKIPDDYWAQDYVDNLPGSIHIPRKSVAETGRTFGEKVAAGSFLDSDGVHVSVVLITDSSGFLFDLDIWKVNDEAIETWPAMEQIKGHE